MYNYDSEVLHYYGKQQRVCVQRDLQNVYLIAPVPVVNCCSW